MGALNACVPLLRNQFKEMMWDVGLCVLRHSMEGSFQAEQSS